MKIYTFIKISIFVLIAIFFTSACELEKTLEGNGNVTKQRIAMQDFTKIEANGIFSVYLEQGDLSRVEIQTDENLQDLVHVKNVNGTLTITTDQGEDFSATRMDVFITTPELSYLSLEGVTSVDCENTLYLSKLRVDKDNTGHLQLRVNLDVLEINSTGIGDIELSGKSNKLKIDNSMTGDISAYRFITKSMKLIHDGTGDIEVYVLDKLEIALTGVGDVYCKGNPGNITNTGENVVGHLYLVD
jgi:hypothetical protein